MFAKLSAGLLVGVLTMVGCKQGQQTTGTQTADGPDTTSSPVSQSAMPQEAIRKMKCSTVGDAMDHLGFQVVQQRPSDMQNFFRSLFPNRLPWERSPDRSGVERFVLVKASLYGLDDGPPENFYAKLSQNMFDLISGRVAGSAKNKRFKISKTFNVIAHKESREEVFAFGGGMNNSSLFIIEPMGVKFISDNFIYFLNCSRAEKFDRHLNYSPDEFAELKNWPGEYPMPALVVKSATRLQGYKFRRSPDVEGTVEGGGTYRYSKSDPILSVVNVESNWGDCEIPKGGTYHPWSRSFPMLNHDFTKYIPEMRRDELYVGDGDYRHLSGISYFEVTDESHTIVGENPARSITEVYRQGEMIKQVGYLSEGYCQFETKDGDIYNSECLHSGRGVVERSRPNSGKVVQFFRAQCTDGMDAWIPANEGLFNNPGVSEGSIVGYGEVE